MPSIRRPHKIVVPYQLTDGGARQDRCPVRCRLHMQVRQRGGQGRLLKGLSVTEIIFRSTFRAGRAHRLFSIAFNQLRDPLNSLYRGLVIL